DGRRHRPLIGLPGMRERTVKIGSAGKIFSLTGWKVGFVCAAPGLMRGLSKAHQFLTFTTPPNLQAAVAYGLDKNDAYFEDLRQTRRYSRRGAGAVGGACAAGGLAGGLWIKRRPARNTRKLRRSCPETRLHERRGRAAGPARK